MAKKTLLTSKKKAMAATNASDLNSPAAPVDLSLEAARKTFESPARPQRLVVIVPAYNEEQTIAQVIEKIPLAIDDIKDIKIVVVNDNSTDRTAELAREAGAIVVSHSKTHGVGVAFRSGIHEALKLQADIIVNMDGDGQFNPQDIPALIRPILYENHGFVTCTRFGDPDNLPKMTGLKMWGNRMMCRLVNLIIWSPKFTDVSCGFRAYSRETALRLNLFGRFTYTQESFIDLASKGIMMTEVSLRVRGTREFGKSKVASNLFWYTLQTVPIIARAVRDMRPLVFFGTIGAIFVLAGMALYTFVSIWWLIEGQTSPWTSFLTIGTGSLVVGLIIGLIALMADQIGRIRRNQEQLLYFAKRRDYDRFSAGSHSAQSPGAIRDSADIDA